MAAHRHFLITEGSSPERPAVREEWIAGERTAGLYPRSGRDSEPAGGSWTHGDVSGRAPIVPGCDCDWDALAAASAA